MKVCPNCKVNTESGTVCPRCQTALENAPGALLGNGENFFKKDYWLYLVKTCWFPVVSLLFGAVRVIGWYDQFGTFAVHVIAFALLSVVFAVIQYRNFGKYSRYFHTADFMRYLTVIGKYLFGGFSMFVAILPFFGELV